MTKANQFAIDNKFKFDAEAVGQKVEELVSMTKQVNMRIKDFNSLMEQKYNKNQGE